MKTTAILLAAALVAPALPALAEGDPAAGKRKAQQCALCHGLDGVARNPEAPTIAGEHYVYITTQLENFRSGRRQHPVMTLVAKNLSDTDIADLASWYSSIRFTVETPQ